MPSLTCQLRELRPGPLGTTHHGNLHKNLFPQLNVNLLRTQFIVGASSSVPAGSPISSGQQRRPEQQYLLAVPHVLPRRFQGSLYRGIGSDSAGRHDPRIALCHPGRALEASRVDLAKGQEEI